MAAESWKCQCIREGHATDNFDGDDKVMSRMIMVMRVMLR